MRGCALRQGGGGRGDGGSDCAGGVAGAPGWNAGFGNRTRPERRPSFGHGGKKLSGHLFENRLFRCDTVPFCQIWIRFSSTAVIRFLVPSRSAARRISRCQFFPVPCSRQGLVSVLAVPLLTNHL